LLSRGWGIHFVLDALALAAAELGESEQAARLLGFTESWYRAHADQRQANEERIARMAQESAEGALGTTRFEVLIAEGAGLPEREAEFLAAKIALNANSYES
jgi:hypothetical protein